MSIINYRKNFKNKNRINEQKVQLVRFCFVVNDMIISVSFYLISP